MVKTPQVGTPVKRGAGWWVPSNSGAWGGYYVEVNRQTVRCTCPSFVHRRTMLPGGECKHIAAVRQEVVLG